MERIIEGRQVYPALLQEIDSTNATGRYVDMSKRRQVAAVAHVKFAGTDELEAGEKVTLELMQATDRSGTGAKSIPSNAATTKALVEVTANIGVLQTVLTLDGSWTDEDEVIVNGVTFVRKGSEPVAANLEFDDMTALVALINANVPGIVATGTSVATLTADAGYTVTVTTDASDLDIETTELAAMVEVLTEQLDTPEGFKFVAPKVTNDGKGEVAVVMLTDRHYMNRVDQPIPHRIL